MNTLNSLLLLFILGPFGCYSIKNLHESPFSIEVDEFGPPGINIIKTDSLSESLINPPKLNIFIIGINEFNEKSHWYNPLLSRHYKNNSDSLKSYFSAFKDANIECLTTADQTSSINLRKWFTRNFIPKARNNINLLFIMSHGAPSLNDLNIITSDTSDDPVGESIKGSEVIKYIESLSDGFGLNTTVFVFLETCHSASIESKMFPLEEAKLKILRINTNLWVSALSTNSSTKGSFMQALLNIWNKNTLDKCISMSESPERLRESLKELYNIEPYEYHSEIVIPYNGNFCLDAFSKFNSVLFLNNLISKKFFYKYYNQNSNESNDGILEGITAIKLYRNKYKFEIFDSATLIHKFEIDMSQKRYEILSIGKSNNQAYLAKSYEELGLMGDYLGLGNIFVGEFNNRAMGLYDRIGDFDSKDRLIKNSANLNK